MGQWKLNGTDVKIVRGNIARDDADAIAVPVGMDLYPDGPSAGAIFAEAYDDLQNKLETVGSQEPGTVTKIDAVGLPSNSILFCSMKVKGETTDPDRFLSDCWDQVLSFAASDSSIDHLSSMPLGLGDHGFPIDTVARAGIRNIQDFRNLDDLESVNIVVYDAIQFTSIDRFGEELLQ